ncbi:hypothetical protein CK216_27725 [Mesorhizobium sp. WSM3876]|nr:hypothetical protein CK216_27725 [Mesorhizobium sp. WSM3876]
MVLANDIEMVRGHVRLGRRIAQQRERITELERLQLPTERAFELLDCSKACKTCMRCICRGCWQRQEKAA